MCYFNQQCIKRTLLAVFLATVVCSTTGASERLFESLTRIAAVIDRKPYNLEVLIVRPDEPGKFPVALLTHGSAGGNDGPWDMRADSELGTWAFDFARRGYLAVAVMRRGYGHSDGTVFDDAGNCKSPSPSLYLDEHAKDLAAVFDAIAHRPDADMSRIIGVGQSAGGAAMLALASHSPFPLAAVVSVSGGLYHYETPNGPIPFDVFSNCDNWKTALIETIGNYGSKARMPTLWLYARNDPWFTPSTAEAMKSAWTQAGGQAELDIFEPDAINGHRIFFEKTSRTELLPRLDSFLRAHGLPTWDEADITVLLDRVNAEQRADLEIYMRKAGSEKALAVSDEGTGKLHWSSDQVTLDRARRAALDECRRLERAACHIIAENFWLALSQKQP